MSKGVLLFAFNSPNCNYVDMAIVTAKRVNHFLNLPVTLITDEYSLPSNDDYQFDKKIIIAADKSNSRNKSVWINKGRYQAYELSPYDETLLLDVDYLVNSTTLLKTFELPTDFCCHATTRFMMEYNAPMEKLSEYSFSTLWATVIRFNKTLRAKQVFDALKMVQNNYEHYASIHGFMADMYRNDYALTLALRIVNGHTDVKSDIIPWHLVHVGNKLKLTKNSPADFNTSYTITQDNWKNDKLKREYIILRDSDFHVLSKQNFMEIT